MELPLDHFRLIGVNPSATSEEILRAFQLRLDKTPNDGFTFEVLTQRAELLRLTADLLTNAENRKEYEDLVLNGASGLEFASNREVAGLMLLWESGSPKEAFKLTRKALQPPQTPALGSSREADLTLLAALSSRDAAIKEQDQRCYSNAADFLQEGIQILQRMGKMGELRKNLEHDLSALLPYRILDLLSRDLIDVETHKKGLSMLVNFINKRGGLEGKNNSENEQILDQKSFEVFFQQVKSFLTVNEQIDLFLNLQKKGSTEAGFLAFLALTAEGYANKKPENLFEALKIIKNINLPELDKMPLIGCLDLLLADIESAENRFLQSSDENLKEWLNLYEGEKLDAICLYCKNWLENEVLKGYRDIRIDEVDLDSWFEDSQIQEFIEKFEKKSNYALSGTYIRKISNNFKKNTDSSNSDSSEPITEAVLAQAEAAERDEERRTREPPRGWWRCCRVLRWSLSRQLRERRVLRVFRVALRGSCGAGAGPHAAALPPVAQHRAGPAARRPADGWFRCRPPPIPGAGGGVVRRCPAPGRRAPGRGTHGSRGRQAHRRAAA